MWVAGDAGVGPVGVTTRLVAAARDHGAQVHLDTAVTGIRRDRAGQVVGVDTGAGPLNGSTVVLAAGVATARLAASAGVRVPVEASPCPADAVSGTTNLVHTVVNTDDFDLRQVAPDQLVAAADSPQQTLTAIRSTFRDDDVELLATQIAVRPMPADGDPIIGPVSDVPGLYVAVMHSAITLAPVVGRLIGLEVVYGIDQAMLHGCRLTRS
ncbi:MAG: NAD(P)/FAD-dependent oxidoreductase [Actinomycetales bacterium]